MRWILMLFAGIAFVTGLFIEHNAKTVIHEIFGGLSFISAAILFAGGAIVDAIVELPRRIVRELPIPDVSPIIAKAPGEPAISATALDKLVADGTLGRQRS